MVRYDDPVVREVRATRKSLWERGGGSIAGVMKPIEQDEDIRRKIRRASRDTAQAK